MDQPPDNLIPVSIEPALPVGTETVLVVEDEAALRNMYVTILESGGYTVLAAESGESALTLAQQYEPRIDLLLTDVVMPGLSGPDLAMKIKQKRPMLTVLYMSGYAGNLMSGEGAVGPGSPLLDKPFSTLALLTKVRAVLEL